MALNPFWSNAAQIFATAAAIEAEADEDDEDACGGDSKVTAAVPVTRFTLARAIPRDGSLALALALRMVFLTLAWHPPHFIPSTRRRTVATSSASSSKVGADVAPSQVGRPWMKDG